MDRTVKRLGAPRSELLARAAEDGLASVGDDETTAAINRALVGLAADHELTDAAAAALVT